VLGRRGLLVRQEGLLAREGRTAHVKRFKRTESGGGEARIALEVQDDGIEGVHLRESGICEAPVPEPGCDGLVGGSAAQHGPDQAKERAGLDALGRLSRSMKAQPQAQRAVCR